MLVLKTCSSLETDRSASGASLGTICSGHCFILNYHLKQQQVQLQSPAPTLGVDHGEGDLKNSHESKPIQFNQVVKKSYSGYRLHACSRHM